MTEAEYETLVNNSWQETLRFVYRRVSVLDDAEDITLEVFFRLWKHKDNVDPGKVNRWIKRVAGNCVVDYYRREKSREKPLFEELDKMDPMEVLRDYISRETSDKAVGLVDNVLTETQGWVIHLYYGCGKNGTEIARMIDLSPGAVQQHRVRALATLKRMMTGLFSQE